MSRWLVVAAVLVGCGSQESSAPKPAPRDARPALACKHALECVPARATARDEECTVGGVEVTCPRCGPSGGLLECVDTDGDGCVELIRTECGRPAGCAVLPDEHGVARPGCKPLAADVAINQFGAYGPQGFVACNTGVTLPIVDGKLILAVRTRAMFSGPTTWSVAVTGGKLDVPAAPAEAVYEDLDSDFGELRRTVDVTGVDPAAKDLAIKYTLKDWKEELAFTCDGVSLGSVSP